jgi:rare lipoprotein A
LGVIDESRFFCEEETVVRIFIKKCAMLSVMVIMTVIPLMADAFTPLASTYAREGDEIIWKIDDVAVWKFPVTYAADVSLLSGRFNRLYDAGFKMSDLSVEKSDGKWSLFIGKNHLYSVPQAYAESMKQDPQRFALSLMSRIYEVLGKKNAGKLTPAYQIRGKYETSASISWYGGKFIGRRFANGERFQPTHLTAAAKTLPFGTLVKVTAPSGKSVVVRITDRFFEHKNRVLDLSPAAADLIGIKEAGVPKAKIEVIGRVDTIGGE